MTSKKFKPFKHRFRNKQYLIKSCKSKDYLGYCESPKIKNPKLCIDENLKDKELLRIIIHESLHACLYDLDEDSVDEISRQIASIVKKFGFKQKEEKNVVFQRNSRGNRRS